MAQIESRFIFGWYRGALRYRSISEWSKTLDVSTTAIRIRLDKGEGMQSVIDSKHDEKAWQAWVGFCYAA